jgi:hypothetical protein
MNILERCDVDRVTIHSDERTNGLRISSLHTWIQTTCFDSIVQTRAVLRRITILHIFPVCKSVGQLRKPCSAQISHVGWGTIEFRLHVGRHSKKASFTFQQVVNMGLLSAITGTP